MKFSREPVAWLTLAAIVIQVVIGVITNNLDTTLLTSLVTAIGGVTARQVVTPVKDARFGDPEPGPRHI
jgi:hypothetical protein